MLTSPGWPKSSCPCCHQTWGTSSCKVQACWMQHGLLQGISMPRPAACRHPSSGQVGTGVSRSVSARGHQVKSLSSECPSRNMAGFTQHCHSILKSTGFARGGLGLEHEVFSYGLPFLDRLLQINGSKNFTPCQPGDQTWLKKDIYLIFCVLTEFLYGLLGFKLAAYACPHHRDGSPEKPLVKTCFLLQS